MKKICRFLSISLVFMFVLCIAVSASAAGGVYFQIVKSSVQNEELKVLVYADDTSRIEADNFSATLGLQPVEQLTLTALSKADYGTSYYIVIDTSRRMNANALKDARQIAHEIVNQMGANDNAAVILTQENAGSIVLSSDKESLFRQIDGAEKLQNNNFLYEGIVDAVDNQQIDANAKNRGCLVVLSAGNDSTGTRTQEEVEAKAAVSDMCIYTVAMVTDSNNQNLRNKATALGVLARNAKGGIDFVWGLRDSMSASEISQSIADNEAAFYLLNMLPAGGQSFQTDAALSVSFTTNAGKVMIDEMSIPVSTLTQLVPVPTDTPQPTPENTIDSSGTDTADSSDAIDIVTPPSFWEQVKTAFMENAVISIAIVAGIVVLVVLLIVLISSRKNKKVKVKTPIEDQTQGLELEQTQQEEEREETVAIRKSLHVRLKDAGTGRNFESAMDETLLVGRPGKSTQLALDNGDKSISERQLMLKWRDGLMLIEDQNSRNGTKVNNNRITSEIQLHQNDNIQIGTSVFIITWWYM